MATPLAIGDFARATHLSARALRHYHRLGLLVPTDVDGDTGYRRYTTDQIATAQVIRRFRDLDMPLDDLGGVLHAPDLQTRNELIARHLARLEQGLARTQSAVSSLRALLEGPHPASLITHRSDPAMPVAAITEAVQLADLSPWFEGAIGELHATLGAQRVPASGPPGAVISNEFFVEEQGELTIFLPTSGEFKPVGRTRPKVLPAVDLATIVHVGSQTDVDRSYGALAAYVSDRALAVEGPIRERYLVGLHDTPNESAWRTEIAWPIFRADTPGLPQGES